MKKIVLFILPLFLLALNIHISKDRATWSLSFNEAEAFNCGEYVPGKSESALESELRKIDNSLGGANRPDSTDPCYQIREQYNNDLKCFQFKKEAESKNKEFRSACGKFNRGNMDCSLTLQACSKCPDTEEFEGINCIKIHNQAQCPALSGEELKSAKKKRETLSEEVKDLQGEIREQEKDLAEAQNEYEDTLLKLEEEHKKALRDLKRKTEEVSEDLKARLESHKSGLTEALGKQLAPIQAKINNALKVSHAFENAIFDIHMKHQIAKRKIVLECETWATEQLAKYRSRRRAAIRSGTVKVSLSSLLRRGRTKFGEEDQRALKNYNSQCLKRRSGDFKLLSEEHRENLKRIEQEKQVHRQEIDNLKKSLMSLHAEASKQEDKAIQAYSSGMQKNISEYKEALKSHHEAYFKAKQNLQKQGRSLTVAHKHLTEKKMMLRAKGGELTRDRALIAFLKNQGVSEETSKSDYNEALSSWSDALEYYTKAKNHCCSRDNLMACESMTSKVEKLENPGSSKDSDDEDSEDSDFGNK